MTITTAITRLITGSSQFQPRHSARPPATSTPADTAASAAMCRNAPRMLRSSRPPRRNSSAVAVLMTMPTPATAMMVTPCTGCGEARRCAASQASAPMATSSSKALAKAARMDARCQP